MENINVDEKILSYNDVVLRRSDLDILSGPYFLNDRIIEFYFSYLTSCYPIEDILLVPPSITFWIKECPDIASLKDFVEPLYFSRKQLIIFPINDNADVTIAEGGSHWSLLAFERNENIFVHHDSSGGINNMHANRVFRAVIYCMSSDAKYVDCSLTPRQTNGYDCGLYVTAIAREICRWYGCDERPKHVKDLWFSAVKEQITPFLVSKMRNEILELVQSLMVK